MRREVELHDAFFFTCDHCGEDNFFPVRVLAREEVESLVLEGEGLTDAEEEWAKAYLASVLGGKTGSYWATSPREVQCRSCGAEFDVAECREGIDD
jgi:hypothetical protein